MLKEYGFELVYASIDEFQMDIAETEPQELVKSIQNRIQETFNITASIGVAKNWLLAKLASKINKPNGIAIIRETDLTETLSKIPVEKLCGVGEKSSLVLHALGVRTCLDLYQKSANFLEKTLGKFGLNLYISLHSTDSFNQPDNEPAGPKSIGHSYTLPRASENPVFIRAWIRLLSEMVAERLRSNNLISNTVHLWLNGPEIGNFSAQKTFQQPINDGHEIYLRTVKIMAKISQKTPRIRAFGVSCSNLTPANNYPPLFKEQKRREDLIKTIDKINARYGDGSIFPAIIDLTRKMQ
jgi:DNA polymerase-4